MSTTKPTGVCRINQWTKNSAEHAEGVENYCYESLAFSRHSVDLEFDEEVMKPEKLTKAPHNAGFNPDTMKVSRWYQETTRNGDVSHFSSTSRMSDTFVETDRTSYRGRKSIEEDEERLAMKEGDAQALHAFLSNSDKMHRATSDDAYTQAWFDNSRLSVFPQSVRKRKRRWVIQGISIPIPEQSYSPRGRLGKQLCSCYFDGRGWQFADRHKVVALKTMAWWDATQTEAVICQSAQELIPMVMFVFFGNQLRTIVSFLMQRSLRWS